MATPKLAPPQPGTVDLTTIAAELEAEIAEAKARLDDLLGQRKMLQKVARLAALAQEGAVVTNGVDA